MVPAGKVEPLRGGEGDGLCQGSREDPAMTGIRPEVRERMERWSEPALGAVVLALGLWTATRGGWLLAAGGGVVAALGAGWLILGLRRLRFRGQGDAPGLVVLDESRITYMGPRIGGSISLDELTEIRLLTLRGRRAWRLRQADGQVLLVPLDSTGAEALFDAFSSLPGLSSATLVAALAGDGPATGQSLPAVGGGDRLVWRRQGRGISPL